MKKNLKQLEDKVISYIFLAPSIVILGLFMMYPIVWAFIASFKNIKLIDMVKARGIGSTFTVPGKFTGFENYINVFKDENFLNALINMAYLAIIYIPITIALSILLAVLLNQKLKGTNFFRTALFVPYIVSLVSAGLLFKFLFQGDGLVNGVLQMLEATNVKWLLNRWTALFVVALMNSWRKVGYFMLIYLAGLQNIPETLYEASKIDGATPKQSFMKITLPLLNKISFVVFILLLIDTLKVFQEIYILTGAKGGEIATVPFYIYTNAFVSNKFGFASAMSYVLFMITLVILAIRGYLSRKNNY